MPSKPTRLFWDPAISRRSWKPPSHSSMPGRKSSPKTTMMTVSWVSRCLRMRSAARQCSTTVCGSVPKDWMSGLRPASIMRFCTARENASPRLGSSSANRGFCTSEVAVSEFALSSSSIGPSRYAAEASACVAAVCPAAPESGICAPGLKSNASPIATTAPNAAHTWCCGLFPTPAHATPCERPTSVSAVSTPCRRRSGSRSGTRPPQASCDGRLVNYRPFSACSRMRSESCAGIGS